jgi:diguanylate cyclase
MNTALLEEMDLGHSTDVAGRAMRSMSEHGVPPTPQNFSVWFAYALGSLPALQKTIDALFASKSNFDAETNRKLYEAFIASSLETHDLDASHQLSDVVHRARRFLQVAIADQKSQIASLSEATVECGAAMDPGPIILKLIDQLADASSRAIALEANFTSTSQQLDKVRASLRDAERRSNTDALTGLANRRSLDAFLRSELINAMESGNSLSVFMLDIDHFKQFNDKHGHRVGDQVLKLVSRVLQESMREVDLAARYGGEELFAVLPGANIAAAITVAERIRAQISNARLTKRRSGTEIGSVTVSIGIAEFRSTETAEMMIDRCDRALYRAKQLGRNRTESEIPFQEEV